VAGGGVASVAETAKIDFSRPVPAGGSVRSALIDPAPLKAQRTELALQTGAGAEFGVWERTSIGVDVRYLHIVGPGDAGNGVRGSSNLVRVSGRVSARLVPQTNMQSLRATIRSTHPWLRLDTTGSTAVSPGNGPATQISTARRVQFTARMPWNVRQCRDRRSNTHRGRLYWHGLSARYIRGPRRAYRGITAAVLCASVLLRLGIRWLDDRRPVALETHISRHVKNCSAHVLSAFLQPIEVAHGPRTRRRRRTLLPSSRHRAAVRARHRAK
jgi:hypothetical protein